MKPDEIEAKVDRGRRAQAALQAAEGLIDEAALRYIREIVAAQRRTEPVAHDKYVEAIASVRALWDLQSRLERARDEGQRASEQVEP